jgi:hypothetical protein
MSWQNPQWIVAVVPLLALIVMLKLRRQIDAEASGSFRQVITGLIILASVGVIRLYHDSGLLQPVPFISDPVFHDVITWIIAITGATFLVSGVYHWLPLSREYRKYREQRVKKAEFIAKIERLISVENRLDMILKKALEHMTEDFGFRAGIALKYSATRRALFLAAATGEVAISVADMYRLAFSESGWQRHLDGVAPHSAGIVSGLGEITTNPNLLLPICVHRRPACLILLWNNPETPVDHHDELGLRIASEIIARKIGADETALRLEAVQARNMWQDRTYVRITAARETANRVAQLAYAIRELVPADLVMMTQHANHRGKYRRISVGQNHSPLIEEGLTLPADGSLMDCVLSAQGPFTIRDVEATRDPSDHAFPRVRSLAVIPFSNPSGTSCLLLGGQRRMLRLISRYRLVESIQVLLPSLVTADDMSDTLTVNELTTSLKRLIDYVGLAPTFRDACTYAATLLHDYLGLDMVRISVPDQDGRFLESHALEMSGREMPTVPKTGTLILGLMPRHEQVLQLGQTLVVSATSGVGPFAEIEERQIFCPPLRSAALVPITVNHCPRGIISVANHAGEKISDNDLKFIETVAAVLGVAVRMTAGWTHPKTELEEAAERFAPPAKVVNRLTAGTAAPARIRIRKGAEISPNGADRPGSSMSVPFESVLG